MSSENIQLCRSTLRHKLLGVGIGPLLLAESGNDVDETAVVLDAALGAAGLLFLLLLLVNLNKIRDER